MTESDEAFGLLVLDNKLDLWNKQFEAKQNDPNATICGPEYQKKYMDIYQKGPLGWSVEGKAVDYMLKEQLKPLRDTKQESTNKYFTKFCKEAGVKQSSQSFDSGKQHKVQENEGNGKCKWSRYVKEREMAYARSYRTVLFPPAVVGVDGDGNLEHVWRLLLATM